MRMLIGGMTVGRSAITLVGTLLAARPASRDQTIVITII